MGRITEEQKVSVRERLLIEAAKHFANSDYGAANINEIALKAGFAKGTVYNYFRSKDELFGEVIAEAAKKAVARYSSVKGKGSVRDSLRALAAADLSVFKEDEPFMKVLMGEAMSPRREDQDLVLKHLSPFVDAVSAVLAKGAQEGEIRTDKPAAELALVFLGIMALLYIQYWRSAGSWPALDDVPDLAVTFFLDGAGRLDPKQSRNTRKASR